MIKFCTLFSSSSGNSTFISDGDTNLLVDAGVSAKRIVGALKQIDVVPEEIDGILITHEHSDHIAGMGVLAKNYNIPVYANDSTMEHIVKVFKNIPSHCVRTFVTGEAFQIRSALVKPFVTPHDARESVGYSFGLCSKKYAVCTDTGCITKLMLKSLAGSESVVIESNHDEQMLKNGPYPYPLKKRILSDCGHLSNDNCAWLATQLAIWGTKNIVLGHLSDHNNTPQIAYDTTEQKLSDNGITVGKDVCLKVASKSEIVHI